MAGAGHWPAVAMFVERPPGTAGHRLSSRGGVYEALAPDLQPELPLSSQASSRNRMACYPRAADHATIQKGGLAAGQNTKVLGNLGSRNVNF